MAVAPREILRQEPVKIEAGSVADLTVIDPEAAWTVEGGDFYPKPTTPASSERVTGPPPTSTSAATLTMGGRQESRVGTCRQPMSWAWKGAVFGRSLSFSQ